MRVLQFFFQIFLFIGVVGGLIYFFGGNIWLRVGSFSFVEDVKALANSNKQLQQYTSMCQQAPASSESSSPLGVQLRFLDNQRYVTELVCTLIESSPLILKEGKLPLFIAKDPGSSGFFYASSGSNLASVSLTSIGKHIFVELNNDTVTLEATTQAPQNQYPKSECISFGFSCCADDSLVGEGDVRSLGVIDCPTSCFPICQKVPYIELFASDPPSTLDTHELALSSSTADVVFNYGVSSANGKIESVTIDYGDGEVQTSTVAQGIFTHTYTCNGPCKYTASLKVQDASGKTSVESMNSKIYIVRK
jgi:hypothetical protein